MSIALEHVAVRVNGEEKSFSAPITIDQLLVELGLRRELVAVEVNRTLVRRAEFGQRQICDRDEVEIVEFVGGG
jgi:sulfur carrier protein